MTNKFCTALSPPPPTAFLNCDIFPDQRIGTVLCLAVAPSTNNDWEIIKTTLSHLKQISNYLYLTIKR